MSDNDFVRVGIIGIGNIGSAHASAIYEGKVEGLKLCALCDNSPERAEVLVGQYPDVPVFHSADDLMGSGMVDAVIISTPHYGHPVIAVKAFSHDLHVLSEKPVAVYGNAAKEMCEAARNSGKIFAVMFNQRANKLFRKAREIVRSGELGELKRSVWIVTNWYRKQSYYDSGEWRATWSGEGGGVLMNQAPHNLDLWQWICGMPTKIYAECPVAKYHDIEVEDEATVFAEYENGATGVFITSTGDYPGTNRLEITGTKGKLVIEHGKLTLTTLSIDEGEYRRSGEGVKNTVTVTEISDEPYKGHTEVLKSFAKAILYGDELIARGEEGLCELALCNGAYMSAWTGKKISLPLDDDLYFQMLKEKVGTSEIRAHAETKHLEGAEYNCRWDTNW